METSEDEEEDADQGEDADQDENEDADIDEDQDGNEDADENEEASSSSTLREKKDQPLASSKRKNQRNEEENLFEPSLVKRLKTRQNNHQWSWNKTLLLSKKPMHRTRRTMTMMMLLWIPKPDKRDTFWNAVVSARLANHASMDGGA